MTALQWLERVIASEIQLLHARGLLSLGKLLIYLHCHFMAVASRCADSPSQHHCSCRRSSCACARVQLHPQNHMHLRDTVQSQRRHKSQFILGPYVQTLVNPPTAAALAYRPAARLVRTRPLPPRALQLPLHNLPLRHCSCLFITCPFVTAAASS